MTGWELVSGEVSWGFQVTRPRVGLSLFSKVWSPNACVVTLCYMACCDQFGDSWPVGLIRSIDARRLWCTARSMTSIRVEETDGDEIRSGIRSEIRSGIRSGI